MNGVYAWLEPREATCPHAMKIELSHTAHLHSTLAHTSQSEHRPLRYSFGYTLGDRSFYTLRDTTSRHVEFGIPVEGEVKVRSKGGGGLDFCLVCFF